MDRFGLDDFDLISRTILRQMLAEDDERCREIVALPGWRWLRRSTLRNERAKWGRDYRAYWEYAEQLARDSLLLQLRRTP